VDLLVITRYLMKLVRERNTMALDRWDILKTVTVLARTGSYRSAAKELGISNTTVARHIEKLQSDLSAQVFKMQDGALVLTEIGAQLEQASREFNEQVNYISSGIGAQDAFTGTLRVTTLSFIADYFLAEPCSDWWRAFPSGSLSIESSDQTLAIELGEADIALRLSRPDTLGITRFKAALCPVAIYAPPNHNTERWIGLPLELNDIPDMKMGLAYFGMPPSIRLDSFPAIAKASQTSGLPCILPTCLAQHFPVLQKVECGTRETEIVRELWLLFHEKRNSDPVIRAAVDWIKEVFPSPNQCLCGHCDF
jgi:DNA-binding transcriptional LysR family regulator